MKTLKLATATAATLATLLVVNPASAHDGWEGRYDYAREVSHDGTDYNRDARYDYARVIRSEPIYREVRYAEPREVCSEEPVTERRVYNGAPDPGAILLGAAIGGVIGHQFGHGHGRDFSTAAGAMIGAGHGAAASSYNNSRVVERDSYRTSCRDVRDVRYERQVEAYDVTYRYHGRTYHTQLPYDPGSRVRVRVDVSLEDGDDLN